MLRIETRGTWREMGAQLAEEFRPRFEPVLERFAPWLARDLDHFRPAVAALRQTVLRLVPEIEEETQGMASALNWDADLALGLRYFNEIRTWQLPGCTGIFLNTGDRGPLLARTCDLEPDMSAEVQLCRVNRPRDGIATVLMTYLPLTAGVGFNELGIAFTGASASTKGPANAEGIPGAVFNQMLITRCRSLAEVTDLAARHTLRGKGAIQLACDAEGRSLLLELTAGSPIRVTPRRRDRDWQACTNFCQSKGLVPDADAAYLENAYARYGRLVHQLNEASGMERTLAGIQRLLLDVAQPGMVCHAPHCTFNTVYTFIVELRQRRMHLCPGHPAQTAYEEVAL